MRLKITVFICGAALMILEIIGSRILAPSFGNSLFVWGSLIGIVLGALSLGYFWGGKLADKSPTFHALSMIIAGAGIMTAFIPLMASLILTYDFVVIFGMKYGPLVATIILLSIPSVLLGMVSPYAIRLDVKNIESVGNTAGDLYAISTFGSIVGAFLTAFFLIPALGVKTIVYSTSLLLIIAAIIPSGKKSTQLIIYSSASFLILFIVLLVYPSETGEDNIIFQADTPYQRVTVRDWVNADVRTITLNERYSGATYLHSNDAVFEYTEYFHIPLLMKPDITDIKDVLFVGCGAGTGPRRFHEEYEWMKIDVVDIDPVVNDAAVKYFGLKEDERLRLHVSDGRFFLANSDKKYDLIVLDAFNSIGSIPSHLMTKEFIEEVNRSLRDDGIIVLNIHASIEGESSKILKWEYKTYKEIFPNIYLFPLGKNPERVNNVIMIASKSDTRYSKKEFIDMANSSDIGIKDILRYTEQYLDKEIEIDNDIKILEDDYAPVENLIIPVINQRA